MNATIQRRPGVTAGLRAGDHHRRRPDGHHRCHDAGPVWDFDGWFSIGMSPPYPLPRAVHADDEDPTASWLAWESATSSPPPAAPRWVFGCWTRTFNVLAELKRSLEPSANGYPQMNMFDQPELEAIHAHQPQAIPARRAARRRPGHQRDPKQAGQRAGGQLIGLFLAPHSDSKSSKVTSSFVQSINSSASRNMIASAPASKARSINRFDISRW